MKYKKIILLLVTFIYVSSLYGEAKILQVGLGQNFAQVSNKVYKSELCIYPLIDVELLSLSFPKATIVPNYFSVEAATLLNLEDNKFFNKNVYSFLFNTGVTFDYQSNLSYKSGTRYLTLLLSGGILRNIEGSSIGVKLISRYKRGNRNVYEVQYLKFYAYYDDFKNGTNQIRAGIDVTFDFPQINGEVFKTAMGTAEPKKVWSNRGWYYFVISALVAGAGVYCNYQGDNYYNDYEHATSSGAAIDYRNKSQDAYQTRDVLYYTSIVPLLVTFYSWIRSGGSSK